MTQEIAPYPLVDAEVAQLAEVAEAFTAVVGLQTPHLVQVVRQLIARGKALDNAAQIGDCLTCQGPVMDTGERGTNPQCTLCFGTVVHLLVEELVEQRRVPLDAVTLPVLAEADAYAHGGQG